MFPIASTKEANDEKSLFAAGAGMFTEELPNLHRAGGAGTQPQSSISEGVNFSIGPHCNGTVT